MKKIIISSIIYFVMTMVVAKAAEFADSILRVGMPAPKLWVNKWHKRQKVEDFKKGRFYIVEFTSILCGPCKKANPRLERIHQKYKDKATVIGVYGDQEKNVRFVDTLIKKFNLTYSIASADDQPYPESKRWLKGDPKVEKQLVMNGMRGFCTTFIVNPEGKVVWMGNALDEPFERIVDEFLKGNNDKGNDIYAAYNNEYDAFMKSYMEVKNNVKTQPEKVPDMLKELDRKIEKFPEVHRYIKFKIGLLKVYNEDKYFEYISSLMKTKFKERGSDVLEMVLIYTENDIANQYKPLPVYNQLRTLKTNNYDFLITLAKHNLEIAEPKYAWVFLADIAMVHYLKGEKSKAVEMQKEVIELKKKAGTNPDELEKLLAVYMN